MSAASLPVASAPANSSLEQVKLLFDYTKFHIGLYTTLATLLVATFASKRTEQWAVNRPLIVVGVVAIAVAGLAGGVVAASLPYFTSSKDVYEEVTAPLSARWMTLRSWTYLEHAAFWLAIFAVLAAFLPVVWR